MEKPEKGAPKQPFKPSPSAIRLMPASLASLFIAASVGRVSHLFPRWMSVKIESVHDVTSSQLMLLFLLSQSGELTMGQAAQMLDLTPRAISGLVVGLEKKKYINRAKDKSDARITWIQLTQIGKTFLKSARSDSSNRFQKLFSVLTKKEQIELVRIIEKLTDQMKNQIDE